MKSQNACFHGIKKNLTYLTSGRKLRCRSILFSFLPLFQAAYSHKSYYIILIFFFGYNHTKTFLRYLYINRLYLGILLFYFLLSIVRFLSWSYTHYVYISVIFYHSPELEKKHTPIGLCVTDETRILS